LTLEILQALWWTTPEQSAVQAHVCLTPAHHTVVPHPVWLGPEQPLFITHTQTFTPQHPQVQGRVERQPRLARAKLRGERIRNSKLQQPLGSDTYLAGYGVGCGRGAGAGISRGRGRGGGRGGSRGGRRGGARLLAEGVGGRQVFVAVGAAGVACSSIARDQQWKSKGRS
jgi:hypothetical protein